MILHFPHASRHIPEDVGATFILDQRELADELIKMTDAFTVELFSNPEAEQVIFPVSRLVVDPERFLNDITEPMAKRGMGVIYTNTSDGKVLRNSLPSSERDALIERFYKPHHRTLEEMVTWELDRTDNCILVDCHSFPSIALPCDMDQAAPRPQLCIGTDIYHTPSVLLEAVTTVAAANGVDCEINRPYSGTMVPLRYYRMKRRLWSIMIEVRRDLYMDEHTGRKTDEFKNIRLLVRQITDAIARCRQSMPADLCAEGS